MLKLILIGLGFLFLLFNLAFVLGCCKAASDAEKEAERQYYLYIKTKDQSNNINITNEGE